MTMFTIVVIAIKQGFPEFQQLIVMFSWLDWVYVVLLSFGTVSNQILRYLALQYEEPGKLSQYIYLNVLYQLAFDMAIFKQSYVMLQWIGFGLLFSGYVAKFYTMLTSARKGEKASKKKE